MFWPKLSKFKRLAVRSTPDWSGGFGMELRDAVVLALEVVAPDGR